MASFLYCSPYTVIGLPTIAVAIYVFLLKIVKCKGKLICIVGRVITIERKIKEVSKEIIQKMKQRGLRAVTLQGAIEKLVQYCNIGKIINHIEP